MTNSSLKMFERSVAVIVITTQRLSGASRATRYGSEEAFHFNTLYVCIITCIYICHPDETRLSQNKNRRSTIMLVMKKTAER